jgi:methyl-accepting chemotaxis protein
MSEQLENFQVAFTHNGKDLLETLQKVLEAFGKIERELSSNLNKELEGTTDAFDSVSESVEEAAKNTEEFDKGLKDTTEGLDSFSESAEDAVKNTKEFDKRLKDSKATTEKLKKEMGGLVKVAAGIAGGFMAASYAIWRTVNSQTKAADASTKMARNMGISVESLTELQYAASLGGVNTANLEMALRTLTRTAESGAKGYSAIGVNVKKSNGELKSADDLLKEVGTKLGAMKDKTAAAAIATQLMGEQGARMISVFSTGGLEKAIEEARRLGIVVGPEFGKQAEEFQDALTRLKASVSGFAMNLTSQLGPKLTKYMGDLTERVIAFRDSADGRRLSEGISRFADLAMRAFDIASKIGPVLLEWGVTLGNVLLPLGDFLAKLLESEGTVRLIGDAIVAAFGAMMVAKIATFTQALWGAVAAAKALAVAQGAAAGAGAVGGARGLLGGLGSGAKGGLFGLAAASAFMGGKAIYDVLKERKDHKNTMSQIAAQDARANKIGALVKQMNEAKASGQTGVATMLQEQIQALRNPNGTTPQGPDVVGSDTVSGRTTFYQTNNIRQENNIALEMDKLRQYLGTNLAQIVRSQLQQEFAGSRVVAMGGA